MVGAKPRASRLPDVLVDDVRQPKLERRETAFESETCLHRVLIDRKFGVVCSAREGVESRVARRLENVCDVRLPEDEPVSSND